MGIELKESGCSYVYHTRISYKNGGDGIEERVEEVSDIIATILMEGWVLTRTVSLATEHHIWPVLSSCHSVRGI